jgi:hypothetical protein
MVNRLNPEEKSETRNNALLKAERSNNMQKELIVKENRDGNLVPVSIPDETIEQIISMGNNVAMWGKLVDNGISINNKTIAEARGIIIDIHQYLVKWDNKQPHKIANVVNDEDIPEGYERRVDLKILIDDQIVGISLAKSSFKYQLAPYLIGTIKYYYW